MSKLLDFYDKKYKTLFIIPVVMLILALGVIGYNYAVTGDFIQKDVSLIGGTTISIPDSKGLTREQAQALLSNYDVNVRELTSATSKGLIIDTSVDVSQAETIINSLSSEIQLTKDEYTLESIGSSLGKSFFEETIKAVIYALLFMAAVVFLYFRIPVPSLAVILAAVSDIIITWAILILLGVKLSTSGIAAFLMLIGYSVDTDILLTSRVLKRRGTSIFEATVGAMKTGLTMTMASIAAVVVAYVFTTSFVVKQIMLILIIGLLVDIVMTWMQNAGLLRWYLERKHVKD